MDAITVERARRNDRDAQATLVRALQDVWFRVCRATLGNDDLANDATQEAAVRFLRELPHFKGHSSISTWSIGIAINVAREFRRASLRVNDHEARVRIAASQNAARNPIDAAQATEESQMIHGMLDDLPERQREAIVLRFFEDMSVEEAALAMGCATGTVKATVHQALRAMKKRLKQPT